MRYLSTISSAKASAFLNNFGAYGASIDQVLENARVNPHVLLSPDQRITSAELKKIMEEAVRLTNNEDIGLLQGESISRGFSNILGYVLLNCSTLGEAAEKYCKYERIVDGTSITGLRLDRSQYHITITTTDDILANVRQFSDFKLSGIMSYAKLLTGRKIIPVKACLTYERPKNTLLHERIFECPVHFGKECDMLIFKREDFDIPVIEPNKSLLALFEKIAQDELEELGVHGIYTERISNTIIGELKGSLPTIDRIAAMLSMSTRNLQLCLKKEGTTFTGLVNEIRKKTAFNYLSDSGNSIDEIAFVLGFSESSAFHRAFKRWTNMTPGEFRCRPPKGER